MSFAVGAGEVVTLLGRNGMGKTTTIRTLMGLLAGARRHARRSRAKHCSAARPIASRSAASAWCPRAGRYSRRCRSRRTWSRPRPRGIGAARWTLPRVYEFFPRLAERRANMGNQLSGGEQQMLAIGRALMTNPKLLILDEATEGLAPLIRAEIWACLARLKSEGQSILLVDKHLDALTKLADRHVVIEKGHVVWTGTSAALAADASVKQRYLQV